MGNSVKRGKRDIYRGNGKSFMVTVGTGKYRGHYTAVAVMLGLSLCLAGA